MTRGIMSDYPHDPEIEHQKPERRRHERAHKIDQTYMEGFLHDELVPAFSAVLFSLSRPFHGFSLVGDPVPPLQDLL